ncbi:MAG: hypothetical protein GY717_09695 [Rhodobacteraceae bacterium]|nr:hypothetical protein [Paracoccaceae bacterium]
MSDAATDPVRHTFRADRATYLRDNAWLAAMAMAAGMAILWAMGNAHIWTGALGGLAAIGLRAWYMASEELAAEWHLTDAHINGPHGRSAKLAEITGLKRLAGTVQVITSTGNKHLIKYQADPAGTIARLDAARQGAAQ